ncbi:two component transcriptional regulator [Fimbriimonas ginsengisoli Gsoil 348]|uniref:Two component transcriptional regulator n=1 Tax=Fimbriimonas ginsengisoli Gsoil 348 TaxID=661478 RepID=A0A068NRA9_FIMGI|nr:response regulator [Fimbriimonas ginsengisoli]AIE84124.1 two component transcriptional regulator [Fimbriimonas ginsengisoli Gsoil 348]
MVIDDEAAIRRFLRASLDPGEYTLTEAADGRNGIRAIATENPEVVLLDLGLPDMDGLDVTREVRQWSELPIIVLSARGQERDKVAALDAGADDYLTKPFGVPELLARIRVALRHTGKSAAPEPVIEAHGVRIDLAARQVFRGSEEIHLTPIEFKLLATLARNPGRVVTHRQLLTEVWGPAYAEESQYLRVYTGQLRHKLEASPARPKLITNEPGVGYRLRIDE